MIGVCIICFSIGIYLFAMSSSQCVKSSLFSISRNSKLKLNQKRIFEQFNEFIQFHSRVKQLSVNTTIALLSNPNKKDYLFF